MSNQNPKAAVIMGSDSDLPIVRKTIEVLRNLGLNMK